MSPHFVKSISGSTSFGTTTCVSIHRTVRLQQDQRVRGLQHADRRRGLNCYFFLTEGMDAGNRHVADTHQYISGLCRLRPETDPFLERSHLLYLERCKHVVKYEPTQALGVCYRVARPTLRRQCAAGDCGAANVPTVLNLVQANYPAHHVLLIQTGVLDHHGHSETHVSLGADV